ncbi:mannitol dehydrogenase family protein [Dyella psychrodurans]|uniref:Mannitol dehydrogenase family protein n=1 Tax=Dyella psychrodurans TaxID=1927960 RepID=A0A370XA62_9GAMM|nr:mannitol dehydrogenase family protein [Dyella psychrodurans]RDS85276.1 mannitol dehydrogenase family protein [Dyella psychrodurans]
MASTTSNHANRLSEWSLASLPASVIKPAYETGRTRIGIVHIGIGAFHRAHQAVYIDDLLADRPDWAICGVSLHSAEVSQALTPQDGLYTLLLLGQQTRLRVIGSIRELLCARDEQAAVLTRLADPAVCLVTLTITEKGYCLTGDNLDVTHPDIVHDFASPESPRSAIGYIVAGLRSRRRQGLIPYTVLSCDNLADNGHRLRRAVLQYAQRIDPRLADWIEAKVAFPCSMVDSITPATDDALRDRINGELGYTDAWPIQRETYSQWVIEDRFCNDRPPFERVGVTMSHDIAGYDRAKLRFLNGAHSTLAYLGSLMNIETVADAMDEPLLASFVEHLMRKAIAPAIALPGNLDASAYIAAILERFRNPAIRHRLLQIAWDGSQKLPVRLLSTIADARAIGQPIDMLCLPIAGWMQFVRRQAHNGVALVDPLDDALSAIGRSCTGDAQADVDAFLKLDNVFAPLSEDAAFVHALRAAYAALDDGSPASVARALTMALNA